MAQKQMDLMGMTLLFILGMVLLGCLCYMAVASEASTQACKGSECPQAQHKGQKPASDFDIPMGLFFPGFPLL